RASDSLPGARAAVPRSRQASRPLANEDRGRRPEVPPHDADRPRAGLRAGACSGRAVAAGGARAPAPARRRRALPAGAARRARRRGLGGAPPAGVTVRLAGPSGRWEAPLRLESDGPCIVARGVLRVREPARWWPHTHGMPALHEVTLVVDDADDAVRVAGGRVGFRELAFGTLPGHDVERDRIHL